MGDTAIPDPSTAQYSIFCEAKDHDKPLVMHDISFGRLIDEVVVPFQENKPFFVDGAPLKKEKIDRLKILIQGPGFSRAFTDLHQTLKYGAPDRSRTFGEQYHTRLEAVIRESCTDVTAQVISAFDNQIKPKIRDYLPKRQELISAALQVFVESMKLLAK